MANPLNVLVKDKLYNCPLCNFSSELLNKLAHHRKYCKGYLLKYTCPVCPKTSVKKISNWELALLHSAKCIPQDDLKIMCLFCCKSVHAEKYPMHIHSEILSIDFIKKLLTLAKKNGIDNLNCCYCNCMLPNSYIKSIHEQLHRKIVKRQAEVLADSKIPKGPRKRRALKLVKDNWEPGNGIRIPRNHLSYRLKQPPKNLKEMTRALVGETKFFCPHCPNHYKTSQETQNHVRERHPKVGLPVRFSVDVSLPRGADLNTPYSSMIKLDSPYRCYVCLKAVYSKVGLVFHIKNCEKLQIKKPILVKLKEEDKLAMEEWRSSQNFK